MSKYATARPYAASYILARRDDGKYAFVLRSNTGWMDGYFSLPAGKVEIGESFSAAAAREAEEEIGITVQQSDLEQVLVCHRNEGDEADMCWVDVFFEVTSWQGDIYNAEPDVHGEIAWFALDGLPDNVIPSLQQALEHFNAGTSYCEIGWK